MKTSKNPKKETVKINLPSPVGPERPLNVVRFWIPPAIVGQPPLVQGPIIMKALGPK